MKKVLYIITLFLGLFVLMGTVNAQIQETGIKEAVEEEIEYFGNSENFSDEQTFNAYQQYVLKMKTADLSDYKEDDSKVNIYIFRGKTCWHCLDEISWLSTKVKEYGKYFNIRTYEVWNNKDNNKLMKNVAKVLGENVNGVPYTIIGKKTYDGFSEKTGEAMLEEVKIQYEDKNRYDIKNDVNLEDGSLINNNDTSKVVMLLLVSLVVIGGIAFIVYISKSK